MRRTEFTVRITSDESGEGPSGREGFPISGREMFAER